MLPRSGSIESVGSSASSCARRRADAVPIRIPGRIASAPQRASRGSSRRVYAPTASPSSVGRGHVLRRVHGDVDAALEQRLLELLHEHAAGADLAERPRAIAVARGRDRHERDLDPGPAQRLGGALGLGEREPTAAGADAKQHSTAGSRCAARRTARPAARPDADERGGSLQRQRPPDDHRSRHDCSSSPSPNRWRTTSA